MNNRALQNFGTANWAGVPNQVGAHTQSELRRSSADVEFEHDFLADQVVTFASEFHVEIEAVDRELGAERNLILTYLNDGGEGNLLGHTVHGQVPGDDRISGLLGNRHRFEDGRRELRDVEEVSVFEMSGKTVVIGPEAGHLNHDLAACGGQFAVGDLEFAGEIREAAAVAAGDLGANEFDLRGGWIDCQRAPLGARGGRRGGVRAGTDLRGRDFIRRV